MTVAHYILFAGTITFAVIVIKRIRKHNRFVDFMDSLTAPTSVKSMSDRNKINQLARYAGMRVFVEEDEYWYRLDRNLETWTKIL